MFIADTLQIIRNTEKNPVKEGMIEKLDEMLNQYGVTHAFTLPRGDENGIALDDEEYLYVLYDGAKDEMVFSLVYMLWAKTIRNVEDERILKAMTKMTTK